MAEGTATPAPSPGDDKKPETGSTPPLADLTGRPEPAPGPLTKPAPVVRPAQRRPRWLVPVIAVIVLAAAGGAVLVWQLTQTMP